MTTTITTKTPARSIYEDMTEAERYLFDGPVEIWGDAEAAVARGAIYLDRVMPGWADRVEILELNLRSTCDCVLGQLFQDERNELVTQIPEDYFFQLIAAGNGAIASAGLNSGYDLALQLFRINETHAQRATYHLDMKATPANFFGFDQMPAYTYDALTRAWEPVIELRKSVPTASKEH